jgi:PTS system nitrogen regulatory IIA component
VAELLAVSEKTIYRWIRQNKLPAFKIGEQFRFSRVEVLEWATAQRINLPADALCAPDGAGGAVPTLSEALRAGGIHYRVGGADRNAVLKSAVDLVPVPEEVDRSFLLQVLVARENLASTGCGDGIAIPHVRNPIVMHVPRPMVTLCFLEQAVDFGALDGKPVHALFTLISPTTAAHLGLLSRLAFGLRNADFAGVIHRPGTREEIIERAAAVDRGMPQRSGAGAKKAGAA